MHVLACYLRVLAASLLLLLLLLLQQGACVDEAGQQRTPGAGAAALTEVALGRVVPLTLTAAHTWWRIQNLTV